MTGYKQILDLNPCHGCGLRTEGCHGSCKAYLNWKIELKISREELYKKRHEVYELDHYTLFGRKARAKWDVRK